MQSLLPPVAEDISTASELVASTDIDCQRCCLVPSRAVQQSRDACHGRHRLSMLPPPTTTIESKSGCHRRRDRSSQHHGWLSTLMQSLLAPQALHSPRACTCRRWMMQHRPRAIWAVMNTETEAANATAGTRLSHSRCCLQRQMT